MGEGFLSVNVFFADHALPVSDVQVLVKDTAGRIIHSLKTDENGITVKVRLSAPDKRNSTDPNASGERFQSYDVDIPSVKGYKRVIVHGVQIFDTESSILPVQIHPQIEGETIENNTDEIDIPYEHGVDVPRRSQEASYPWENRETRFQSMQTGTANEVAIPEYITVHLGSPNAAARNVRVPFIDYVNVCYCLGRVSGNEF